MKFIFDFDDVLFENTKKFKRHMFSCLEKGGIQYDESEKYYKETRGQKFSLINFIRHFISDKEKADGIYEEIMTECESFVYRNLLEVIKKIGKNNCYIITNGEKYFQEDKINRSQIKTCFSRIVTVPGSKKAAVEEICREHEREKIIFIDDKAKFFEDLDTKAHPNLKTILFDQTGLEKVKAEIH